MASLKQEQGFSIGISAEKALSMPLDALIQHSKKTAPKKPIAIKLKQHNVKKTVVVPVSKALRARANTAAASSKRQAVINKRRPGLVMSKGLKKRAPLAGQARRQASTVMRAARGVTAGGKHKPKKSAHVAGGLDVSNIINHFRTHPKKFDVPKGSNLRITINLHNVKPVVGTKK